VIDPDLTIDERIRDLIAQEIAEFDHADAASARTLEDFRSALRDPREVTVNFSGGITQRCWSVTRGDGTYRVVYLPLAGYFSLCVESDFGPLDIGVHGSAIGCFSSV
jgi:hypothetical protein